MYVSYIKLHPHRLLCHSHFKTLSSKTLQIQKCSDFLLLLTASSISATIISTSESSKTMFAASNSKHKCFFKWSGSNRLKSLWSKSSYLAQQRELDFIPPLLTRWPKLLASHGALQAGQNKLILDGEISKLDQPMSDWEALTERVDTSGMSNEVQSADWD